MILRKLRRVWRAMFAERWVIVERRNMTAEESAAFDKAFERMDEAFDAMHEAFKSTRKRHVP